MKPRPDIKPLLHGTNVVSINLLRLRRRVAQIAPDMADKMGKPQHAYLRRAAVKAKTGGYFKR
ncbi:MAG: hypothetical protein Q8Q28_10400 [Pseudomonadota bacterium]|nr:hypothetical protein [Pseudomonadota bacterium]